ncbi:MAG: hypothetical protein ACPHQP_07265 [Longimicrobiales bacterium]
MAELEGSGGGAVGKIWRKHGGGYYALLAVGTFLHLEVKSLVDSYGEATGLRDFLETELLEAIITFGLETLLNTFLAGIWPFIWIRGMGLGIAAGAAVGGYLLWSVMLAWLLARREREFRRELGL